jgi:hypothetical protein
MSVRSQSEHDFVSDTLSEHDFASVNCTLF